MPNVKVLEEKKQMVADAAEKFRNASAGVFVNYQGINVEQDTKMRTELREAGVDYFVFKNTLARLAVKEVGFDGLLPVLEKGMTAIAVSEKDPVAPAKILSAYADKIETFNIKAGFVDGIVIDVKGVSQLATLPSKEELIAKILGSLQSPASGLANVINANMSGLARVLQAVCDKKAAEQA